MNSDTGPASKHSGRGYLLTKYFPPMLRPPTLCTNDPHIYLIPKRLHPAPSRSWHFLFLTFPPECESLHARMSLISFSSISIYTACVYALWKQDTHPTSQANYSHSSIYHFSLHKYPGLPPNSAHRYPFWAVLRGSYVLSRIELVLVADKVSA